jgi:hypothetical protein
MHAGHSGNPSGDADAETHFKVEIVSNSFEGKLPVARHRLVYTVLDAEFKVGGLGPPPVTSPLAARAQNHSITTRASSRYPKVEMSASGLRGVPGQYHGCAGWQLRCTGDWCQTRGLHYTRLLLGSA